VAACLTELQQLGGAIEDETVREQVASYLERVPNILNEYLQKLQRDKAEQHLHAIWECADTEYKLEVLRRLQASLPSGVSVNNRLACVLVHYRSFCNCITSSKA
jgi:hypothetical protein